jgi:uncharacterized protein
MKTLGIVGTGIAGMSAAYFLKDHYDISVFEKNNYIGGHTNTVTVHDGVEDCPLDTGFMVFNFETYPNLVKLFEKLNVPIKNTDMSFSVRNDKIDLEFNGSSASGLFAQKKNIFKFKFCKMVMEILKFNGDAPNVLNSSKFDDYSIRQYIDHLGLSDYFFDNFLVPMSSAVWSTPVERMGDFPAKSLVKFFQNHGFVGVNTQLQWKTVHGGSQEYRSRLIEEFKDKIKVDSAVTKVRETDGKVSLLINGQEHLFDEVIIASHADEALGLLESPTILQQEVLSKFNYQKNIATVHTDTSVMPNLKKNWSSWNFMTREGEPYTVYYMNRLQGVSEKKDFFVNINGERYVDEGQIIQQITYHHPTFDVGAARAQEKIHEMNQEGPIKFTGSYYRYGFHEDALLSSVDLCESILGKKVL